MRLFVTAILIAAWVHTWGSDEPGSESEVWLDGNSFYDAIPHKKSTTIFFDEWSPYMHHFLGNEDYFIALQMNTSFDPFPEDGLSLPGITSVAAIASDSVFGAYIRFLENYSRSQGIHYLVLPDTTGLSLLEKEVLHKTHQISPYYFLHPSILNHEIPDSRKDFETDHFQKPTIWVAGQNQNLGKIKRWSSRSLDEDQVTFLSALREARAATYEHTLSLDAALKTAIFNSGTIAIDPYQLLPITTSVVSYLGSDLTLKRWLSRYATVLDYRKEGVLAVGDARDGYEPSTSVDIIITNNVKQDHPFTQLVLPIDAKNEEYHIGKMLFGSQGIYGQHEKGRVVANAQYLGKSIPSISGMDENKLKGLDSLAAVAIKEYATPGMQVSVVRGGNLVLEKNYGFYTYDSIKPIDENTIYDVASLTKVMATLPAIALLLDRNQIQLDDSISQYLPDFSTSNKSGVTIRQLLAHQGGLRSYIPFWSMMLDGDRLDAFYYKTPEDEANDVRTYGFEPHPIMIDSLKKFIVKSELIKEPKTYNYSDLGFMILHLIVESVSQMPFNVFLQEEFYEPMGMHRTMFNPLAKGYIPSDIAPTEYDERYRNYQVWGEVHDRNALVFGGVAGHAGLFSTSSDIAKMMAMLSNGGYFGGRQYLSHTVLETLNKRYFEKNRRGLGWDKKDGEKDAASRYASDASFGHTGFTGTMVWADTEADLIFVFMSNRIYPDANNWKLAELNIRTGMHDVLYESINSMN